MGRRIWIRAITVAVACAALAGCFFAPGRFTSSLDVGRDRHFRFVYTGELYFLPLMQAEKKATFTAKPCHTEETAEERPCTAGELAAQKKDWETARAEESKRDAQAAQFLFGGIDPADPRAAAEMAERLRRQAGWKRVDYRGGGRFDVVFETEGTLDRDFTFPTFERFPMTNAMVQLSLRDDGSVRIDAPGFGPTGGAGPVGGAGGLMQGMLGENADAGDNPVDGTFTVHTDAQVLANNTDEGPRPDTAGGKALTWVINPRIPAAPTALLQLSPAKSAN